MFRIIDLPLSSISFYFSLIEYRVILHATITSIF